MRTYSRSRRLFPSQTTAKLRFSKFAPRPFVSRTNVPDAGDVVELRFHRVAVKAKFH